jgi:hypothetical protein
MSTFEGTNRHGGFVGDFRCARRRVDQHDGGIGFSRSRARPQCAGAAFHFLHQARQYAVALRGPSHQAMLRIGVQQPHGPLHGGKLPRQISCDGGLADSALASGDGDDSHRTLL